MKCVACSRTRSYSARSTSRRSVHVGSAHSQRNSAPSRPTASAVSAMRSLTSRKTDSVFPILSASSPIAARQRARARRSYARLVEWPEPVARVAAFAREAGAELRLEEFATGTPTARAAAEAVGCELGAIGKSIVFDCDGRVVVALIPGDRRADPEKVAAAVGAARARVVPAADVEAATGFPAGAVAPFPLP